MAKRRIGIIAFILCVCLYLIPCQVQAASTADAKEPITTDKNCSLTISYCSNGIAFSALPPLVSGKTDTVTKAAAQQEAHSPILTYIVIL